jgi:HlyD family secretion protein
MMLDVVTRPHPNADTDASVNESTSTPIRDTSAQDTVLGTAAAGARRRRARWLGAAAGLVLITLASWVVAGWSGGGRSFDSARLRIAEVKRGDLVRDLGADGRVIAANSPTLYAIAGGTVALKVVSGDQVKQGQALALIDSPELRSRLVQEESTLASMEAEASRADLDAQLARSEARKLLDQAEVTRVAAYRDVQRYQRAFEGGAISQLDLNKAQDELQKADLGLAGARKVFAIQDQGADLDARNKRSLAERQQAVVSELQRQVEALVLLAPFDGQVGQVHIPNGTNVAAQAPILTVVDLSVFEVEIKVPEGFARDLALGMPAEIASSGKTFAAEVSAVSPEVVAGEVNARLRFADGQQPPDLRQNQRLSARILMDTRLDVLVVERGPFLEVHGGSAAYVVDARGFAERRAIRTGAASLNGVEIVSGLQPGERIVISGSEYFENSEQVRIN